MGYLSEKLHLRSSQRISLPLLESPRNFSATSKPTSTYVLELSGNIRTYINQTTYFVAGTIRAPKITSTYGIPVETASTVNWLIDMSNKSTKSFDISYCQNLCGEYEKEGKSKQKWNKKKTWNQFRIVKIV